MPLCKIKINKYTKKRYYNILHLGIILTYYAKLQRKKNLWFHLWGKFESIAFLEQSRSKYIILKQIRIESTDCFSVWCVIWKYILCTYLPVDATCSSGVGIELKKRKEKIGTPWIMKIPSNQVTATLLMNGKI